MPLIEFEKHTLANGLDVILHREPSLPVVAVNVWYHVGSKNEVPGRTGFAHLFEHVMFEGSKHHDRSFFAPLQEAGATLNGSTSADRTNYWENVPSNYLELALWLESDRMGFLLDALDDRRFNIQRDVVKNERRQSYENRPYGLVEERLLAALYPPNHPYHWPVIGSMADLDAASLEDVRDFFRHFYSPSNASLALVGDLLLDEAKALAERYFGDLPPGPLVSRLERWVPRLPAEIAVSMDDRVQLPRLYLAWPSAPYLSQEDAELDLLASILAEGRSSRLYRSLVQRRQIAQEVRAHQESGEIASVFGVELTAAPGHRLEELEAAAEEEIERLRQEGPSEEELGRAKTRTETQFVRRLESIGGFGGRADLLNSFNVHAGDPGRLNSYLDRYFAVQASDVRRATQTYLDAGRVRLEVQPRRSLQPIASALDRTAQPRPGSDPSFTPPPHMRQRLANGLEVVVVERRDLPVIAMGLLVRGGAAGDPLERPGLSSLTARMLSEGTTTRSSEQIADEFESLGARLFAQIDREHAFFSTETLSRNWAKALELLADIVTRPTFPEQDLTRVLRERRTDLERIQDDPVGLAERAIDGVLYGPGTPFGHPTEGTLAGLADVDRSQLEALWSSAYQPSRASLILAGDVSLPEAIAGVERALGHWQDRAPAGAPVVPASQAPAVTTLYLLDKPGAAQSVIRAAHPTVPRTDPAYFRLSLLNFAFGGQFTARLNMNLRQDKGYSYGYRSRVEWRRNISSLIAGGSVQTAVTKESVIETLHEFAEINGARPLTAEEFTNARAGMLRGYANLFETPGQVVRQLAELGLYQLSPDYFQWYQSAIAALSLEEARAAGRELVQADQLAVLVVGDRAVIEPGLRELGLPLVHVDSEGKVLG